MRIMNVPSEREYMRKEAITPPQKYFSLKRRYADRIMRRLKRGSVRAL
jgi:hypothetical protein